MLAKLLYQIWISQTVRIKANNVVYCSINKHYLCFIRFRKKTQKGENPPEFKIRGVPRRNLLSKVFAFVNGENALKMKSSLQFIVTAETTCQLCFTLLRYVPFACKPFNKGWRSSTSYKNFLSIRPRNQNRTSKSLD